MPNKKDDPREGSRTADDARREILSVLLLSPVSLLLLWMIVMLVLGNG